MTIELSDLDVPYGVATDITSDGKDIISIKPLYAQRDRDENYDICLDKEGVQELIRVLQFISGEI